MESTLKRVPLWPKFFVVWALVLSLLAATFSPTLADTTTTRNIILGALAVTAGIILYNNYQHKVAYANTVVGYTRDGGVVYGDGRIVYPNGITVYASNTGNQVCTFDGMGTQCQQQRLYGYFPQGYHPACWPPGHCKAFWKTYWKHHKHNGKDKG